MSILDQRRKTMRPARVSDEAAEGLGLASKADGSEDASCAPGMACDDTGNQRLRAADAITALMAEMQLVSRHIEYHWIRNAPRCRYYPNRLNRQFDAIAPNTVWTADLTYIRVGYEWRYFFAIVDLCKRRVIGWGLSDCKTSEFTSAVIKRAFHERGEPLGLLYHCDQGSENTEFL